MKYIEYVKFRGYETSACWNMRYPLYLIDPSNSTLKDWQKANFQKNF